MIEMNSGSWCASVGHFTFKTSIYPDGITSLRRTVERLHQHGILVGMLTFASKVSKTDAYVTPIPDRGFWVDRSATLATDINAREAVIRTSSDLSQWAGSPVCKQKVWEGHVSKHQEVIVNNEIIRYDAIGPDGKWDTFLGCKRGAWGTRPAVHTTGADCRHYAVDGCINGYILDQDAPLFQKTTSRLAYIFSECDFDMVYFDGSEDVDRRRFHYYASNAHATAMRKFTKRPLIHMGGGFTHGLWHSFTRNATVDQYPGTYLAYLNAGGTIKNWPTCKDHIDRSVRRVIACADDMIPGELGWFGIGPRSGKYDGLQFDEIEYLMCKSLAYNAPISLQTSFSRMAAHPLTPDILEIIRRYESVRLTGRIPAPTLKRLEQPGKDFVMLPGLDQDVEHESPEFVEVQQVESVGGTHDVRAFVGAGQSGAIAVVWHFAGKPGKLSMTLAGGEAFDVRGKQLAIKHAGGESEIPIGAGRILIQCPQTKSSALHTALKQATFEPRKPIVLWLQAEDYERSVGSMVKGSTIGVHENDAQGDVVLCPGRIDRSGKKTSYCEYHVKIPHEATWTLWARVRYPTGGDMSFGLVLPGQEVTLTGRQVIGNC